MDFDKELEQLNHMREMLRREKEELLKSTSGDANYEGENDDFAPFSSRNSLDRKGSEHVYSENYGNDNFNVNAGPSEGRLFNPEFAVVSSYTVKFGTPIRSNIEIAGLKYRRPYQN